MFFKKLVDKKKDKLDFDIIPKTNEEYISVTMVVLDSLIAFDFYQVAWIRWLKR